MILLVSSLTSLTNDCCIRLSMCFVSAHINVLHTGTGGGGRVVGVGCAPVQPVKHV